MTSSIVVEKILGNAFAVWDTDGRGRSVSDVLYVTAASEEEARASFRIRVALAASEGGE